MDELLLQQHSDTNAISTPTAKATLTAKCFTDMNNASPAIANKPAELRWCFIFFSPATLVRCDKEGRREEEKGVWGEGWGVG